MNIPHKYFTETFPIIVSFMQFLCRVALGKVHLPAKINSSYAVDL